MRTLYPPIEPYTTQRLPVDSLHTVYVEECGNPHGIPALFLHGGPGGGSTPTHRRFFDPQRYRIILFDQRGCGRSTPHASLVDNTTQHLLADIEHIRNTLGIERWLVFGGSWGSTLGLAYAEEFPETVMALALRGIFLCRDEDTAWFYQSGAHRLAPDYWQDFIQPIPESARGNMIEAYYNVLTGSDENRRMQAAKAWSVWEGRTATLLPDKATEDFFGQRDVALSMGRIECHYFINDSFLERDQLLARADRLKGIPGVIVHGRYDIICPVDQAFELKTAWPEAELNIIPNAGHAATEPGIVDALITATDQFSKDLVIT